VATNEETYGVAGAAFYDGYFPIDEWARTTAAFLAAVARDTGANEPIALELGGLVPVARFGNFTDEPFHADSTINVVVYSRRPTADR